MLDVLFKLTIFPGFAFVFFASLLFEWVMRKLRAMMQNRVGPPFYQPLFDFIKLLSKENIVPIKSRFLTAISTFTLFSTSLVIPFIPMFGQSAIFTTEMNLLFIFELITFTSIGFILIGILSKSSFGFFGAIRESMFLIVYELLFIFSLFIVGLYAGWSIPLSAEPLILRFPFLAIAFLMFIQWKSALAPFSISESEQEIVSGYSTELSGYGFALFQLTKIMMTFLLVMFFVTIFLGGGDFFIFLVKTTVVLFLVASLQVIACRLRIDQAFKVGIFILSLSVVIELIRIIL